MTIDHILADIPYLVKKVKTDLNSTESRVVTFGTRIGGAIAVLARKKFPHVIHGTWSSSGLFTSVMPETDFYEDVASQLLVLSSSNLNCTHDVSKAFQQVKEIVDAKNITRLQELFRIPAEDPIDLNKPQDVQHFYITLFHQIPYYLHHLK